MAIAGLIITIIFSTYHPDNDPVEERNSLASFKKDNLTQIKKVFFFFSWQDASCEKKYGTLPTNACLLLFPEMSTSSAWRVRCDVVGKKWVRKINNIKKRAESRILRGRDPTFDTKYDIWWQHVVHRLQKKVKLITMQYAMQLTSFYCVWERCIADNPPRQVTPTPRIFFLEEKKQQWNPFLFNTTWQDGGQLVKSMQGKKNLCFLQSKKVVPNIYYEHYSFYKNFSYEGNEKEKYALFVSVRLEGCLCCTRKEHDVCYYVFSFSRLTFFSVYTRQRLTLMEYKNTSRNFAFCGTGTDKRRKSIPSVVCRLLPVFILRSDPANHPVYCSTFPFAPFSLFIYTVESKVKFFFQTLSTHMLAHVVAWDLLRWIIDLLE